MHDYTINDKYCRSCAEYETISKFNSTNFSTVINRLIKQTAWGVSMNAPIEPKGDLCNKTYIIWMSCSISISKSQFFKVSKILLALLWEYMSRSTGPRSTSCWKFDAHKAESCHTLFESSQSMCEHLLTYYKWTVKYWGPIE